MIITRNEIIKNVQCNTSIILTKELKLMTFREINSHLIRDNKLYGYGEVIERNFDLFNKGDYSKTIKLIDPSDKEHIEYLGFSYQDDSSNPLEIIVGGKKEGIIHLLREEFIFDGEEAYHLSPIIIPADFEFPCILPPIEYGDGVNGISDEAFECINKSLESRDKIVKILEKALK